MDHILQLEHPYGGLKHCNPGVARFRSSVDASQIVYSFAAIASLSLLFSFSMGNSLSSTLSAWLLAIGSFVMTKKALFVLSNVIFLFLAADYCCYFTTSTSASDFAACESNGGLAKQAQRHQKVEQCALQLQSSVSDSGGLYHKNSSTASENCTHPKKENGFEIRSMPGMSENTTPLEEQAEQDDVPVTSKLDLLRLDEEEDSITLETVVVEEPTCGTDQELEKLEIDELNKKFEEFIQSRRIKWIKEEAGFLTCSGTRSDMSQVDVILP